MPSWKKLVTSGSSPVFNHITSSGNITATSGTGSFAHIQLPANGRIQFDDNPGSNDQYIMGKEHQITIDGDNYVNIYSDLYTTFWGGYVHLKNYLTTESHITASGNISSSGTVTAAGFTTTGTWTFDEATSGTVGITTVQDSGTSFADNDTSFMTAAAVDDRILDYGYTTNTGDMTGVDLTGGTGITIGSETNTTSGDYSATITNAGVTSIVATANETTVSGATGAVTIGIADDVTIPGTLTADTRKFAITSNSTGDYEGDVVYFGNAEGMTAGGIWHYVVGDDESGTWTEADADTEATCDGLLAVSLGEDPSEGMLLRGMVTLNHLPGTLADTLFVSTTAAEATSTAPSGNLNIVRIIGYCLDASNNQIWFNPDNSYIEVTGG